MAPVAGASPPPVRALQPSASYSITMRVRQGQRPGAFARVAGAIGETGAILGAIDLVRVVGGLGAHGDDECSDHVCGTEPR
jgi:hypothetical protein